MMPNRRLSTIRCCVHVGLEWLLGFGSNKGLTSKFSCRPFSYGSFHLHIPYISRALSGPQQTISVGSSVQVTILNYRALKRKKKVVVGVQTQPIPGDALLCLYWCLFLFYIYNWIGPVRTVHTGLRFGPPSGAHLGTPLVMGQKGTQKSK